MASASPRLIDDLVAHLRNRLLSGSCAAGEVLAESGVAHEYGVARPTARAAIDVLVADGLLVREAHLPARVVTVPREDLDEILELLEISERMALARLLARQPGERRPDLASPSAHALLNRITVSSGSARIAVIHRRATFELLIGCRQHGIDSAFSGADHIARTLEEATSTGDAGAALSLLDQLHHARRSVIVPHREVARAVPGGRMDSLPLPE